jgi:transcriptional regulator GlxA family with amidase domain
MQTIGIAQDNGAAEYSRRGHGAALAPWQARRVTHHMEAHLDDPLRVADLANLVGLGLRQFSAAFRASFRQPPHTYLLDRRIRRACKLMVMTKEPLSQIAILCGFADQAHLTHIFRARIGKPPNTWRRPRNDDEAAATPTSEEVADAITFMASPEAAFMTGQTLRVNGGTTAS